VQGGPSWHPATAQIRHRSENNKGLHCCNPLMLLVGRAGIEPATNGLRESGPNRDHFSNQALAAHAKFQEQPCTAWSGRYEGKKSYEIATLASTRRNSIAPMPGQPCMMRNRENHDAIRLWPINDGKWEVLDDDAANSWRCRRARERKSQSARGRFLDCGSETHPLAGLNLIVVGDVGKKLLARRRDKTRPFHRVLRLASAKTFSAERA